MCVILHHASDKATFVDSLFSVHRPHPLLLCRLPFHTMKLISGCALNDIHGRS